MIIKTAELMHYEINKKVYVKKVHYIFNNKSGIFNQRRKFFSVLTSEENSYSEANRNVKKQGQKIVFERATLLI